MDDIGGIIFYIIAAAIGIIATVGNKKKSAAQKTKTKTIEEVYNDLFDVKEPDSQAVIDADFEDDFEESEAVPESEPATIIGNQSFEFNITKEGNYSEPMAQQFINEGVSTTGTMESNIPGSDEIKNSEIRTEQKPRWKFDLKRAVIYSEILKRKYY